MSDDELDEILAKTIYDTGAKLTEIGWERWGENLEEAKQAIQAYTAEKVREARIRELEELLGQQDHEGNPVEPTSNTVKQRIAELSQPNKGEE